MVTSVAIGWIMKMGHYANQEVLVLQNSSNSKVVTIPLSEEKSGDGKP